jgi:hypothetical protein
MLLVWRGEGSVKLRQDGLTPAVEVPGTGGEEESPGLKGDWNSVLRSWREEGLGRRPGVA